MHLAAGLRPDPLGECSSSPRPPSRNWGRGAYFQWRSQECELGGLPSLVFQVGLLLVETAAPSNLNRPSAFGPIVSPGSQLCNGVMQ